MSTDKKKKLKPMTKEEEYRNADVPMPKEDIEAMENAVTAALEARSHAAQ